MCKYVKYNGTSYEKLEEQLICYLEKERITDFLNMCETYKEIFDEEEMFAVNVEKNESNSYRKIIPLTHYFINIKRSTILFISILLEAGIQGIMHKASPMDNLPIIPTLVELKKCFCQLDEESGEFCVVLECSKRHLSVSKFENFTNYNNECFNNNLRCRFNRDGICKLEKLEFDSIIKKLVEKKIIDIKDNMYKTNF